jgi:protein TonB
MFEDFQRQTDSLRRRRTMVSALVSLVVYGAIGGAVAVYASTRPEPVVEEEAIDVTFKATPEPEPVKPEPAPPPPPTAAPPPPPEMKVRKVKPPAADPMKPPDEIPEAKPEEGDPSAGIAVVDTGGDPGGNNTAPAPEAPPPPPPPPPPRPKASVPINLPENGVPAQPKPGNAAPEYPAKQRSEGVEGLVVLKIVIREDGSVGDIQVMKGDEPFVSAARSAVKSWRFTPAMLDGQPIATFKIIKVPFTSTK